MAVPPPSSDPLVPDPAKIRLREELRARRSAYVATIGPDGARTAAEAAMRHLLLQFPGTEDFTGELTLFPSWLNLKKGIIFNFTPKDCVGEDSWGKLDFDDKIQELRDCVLVAKVLESLKLHTSLH